MARTNCHPWPFDPRATEEEYGYPDCPLGSMEPRTMIPAIFLSDSPLVAKNETFDSKISVISLKPENRDNSMGSGTSPRCPRALLLLFCFSLSDLGLQFAVGVLHFLYACFIFYCRDISYWLSFSYCLDYSSHYFCAARLR